MPAPKNTFKQALANGERQIGCWLSSGEAVIAEILGTCGFDWLVIDGEHGPNDIRSIRDQLMALEASPSNPVVRLPIGEAWMVKQALDVGAQNILIPMVETADQAREMVHACQYPPHGTRGVGATAARATMFGKTTEYIQTADQEICLLLQVENREGIANLDDILAVDGVDGVFIGPADLSTDMGYQGDAAHPEVRAVTEDALKRIKAAGKSPGILGVAEEAAQAYFDMGAEFLAVGIDMVLLAQNARALAAKWKGK